MKAVRFITVPAKGTSILVDDIKFTFGVDVGIVKGNYRATALNFAKALLDVGYTVYVRHGIEKVEKEGKNSKISSGTEIYFSN